jgi:hypothetical protein
VLDDEFVGAAFEPCRNTVEFVDQLSIERRQGLVEFELGSVNHRGGRGSMSGRPGVKEASAVEFGTAAVGKLESDSPGASQKFVPSLTTQRRGERFGSITHISGLFESFLAGEGGEAFT